jgi:hypothetical protein
MWMRKAMIRWFTLFSLPAVLLSCQSKSVQEPGTSGKKTPLDVLERHPVRNPEFWGEYERKPLEQRLITCPDELVDYLIKDNIDQGYPERPAAAHLTDDYLLDIRAALSGLPQGVKRLAEKKLVGICFVRDLGGSAYGESVLDSGGKTIALFLVLDTSVLNRSANAWFTWRENSPFREDPGYRIIAKIEESEDDNRKNAVRFILLHEFGHIISIGAGVHPDWRLPPSVSTSRNFKFFSLAWVVNRGRYVSRFESEFPLRSKIHYYRGHQTKVSISLAKEMYDQLERTNYPTLYGSTSFYDDFAESFATYVHTVIDKRPFTITIVKDGKVVKEYRACWGQERCRAKEAILADLLSQPAEKKELNP